MDKNNHSPVLARYAWASLVGAIICLLLMGLDPRFLSGEPIWMKPAKFFASTAIFAFTFEYGLARLRSGLPKVNFVRHFVTAGFTIEMLIIIFQAVRGQKSHFNYSTLLNGLLFSVMGVVITLTVLVIGYGAWLCYRKNFSGSRALRLGFVGGTIIFCLSAFEGAAMPRPTPAQLAAIKAGEGSPLIGSHFVGSEEGSTRTFSLTGWSLESGDLRVAHFLGMHQLQIVLLLIFGMRRRGFDLNSSRAVGLVRLELLFGFALFLIVLFQALDAQSVFTPNLKYGLLMSLAVLGQLVPFAWVVTASRVPEVESSHV